MEQWQNKPADVLIVGAGPTGLMMACQLAIHHVPFRIIDKNLTSSINSGALILQARSLEIFEQMGIAEEAIKSGIVANKINVVYNDNKIISTTIKDIGGNLSKFPFILMLEQSNTEKLLIKFLTGHGHYVERGIRFKSFFEDKEEVLSILVLPDGSEQSIKTKYLIAADGAKSTVRNFLNIPFEGKTYPNPIFILDCKAKTQLIHDEITFAFSKSSVVGFFPLPGSRWRVDSNISKKPEKFKTITLDNISDDFHIQTKLIIAIEVYEWFSVTHSHQKYARQIRVGNCFLAGDAAHVNTPVGAQGMNTGLQDAFNLAWKLSLIIKHKAKKELLDTYSNERLGISKGFARYADIVFKLVTSNNILVKFFRFYILRMFFRFVFPLVEKRKTFRLRFFKSISQIGIHYRKSILSDKTTEFNFLKGTPRTGDRLPYIEFFNKGKKTNSYEILDAVCFNLIVFANDLPKDINELAQKYNLAIESIAQLSETKELYECFGIHNAGYYLIRPDRHIALQSATLNTQFLKNYLEKFLL